MRLLLATPLYPPEPGGPATYTKLLEERLPDLGMEVHVEKFSAVRSLPKVARHFAYFLRLLKEGRNSDLMLVLDPVSTGFPSALASIVLRKPLVLKVVGDYAWEQGRQRFGITVTLDEFVNTRNVPLAVRLLRHMQTWVARRAHTIIVPSEYLKGIVSAWGVSTDKIVVVPNAVTLSDGGKVPIVIDQLPHPRIVTVARLVSWKGIDKLIEAVASVRASGVEASLLIVGEGPERERLEKLARESLPENCILTGALPPEDVHAVVRSSDIFVLNSTYEGLSHVLIEALMAGLPIVATDAGGNREVLKEESGVVVPTGDQQALISALTSLLTSDSRRERLRNAALRRSHAYTAEAMILRTHEVLSTI